MIVNRVFFLFFLFFFVVINAVNADEPEKHLLILYNSDTKGLIEGCGCKHVQGGLSRRASLLKEIRGKNENILLLDGGDSFRGNAPFSPLRAETSMKALDLMRYDALNIADGELSLGLKFFKDLQKKTSIPLLSANLYKTKKPLGKSYLIKNFDGFTVGVIGIVSPACFYDGFLSIEGLDIQNPEEALKEILPKVKEQADIVILLSHLGKNETTALLQKVSGVDVAIIGHDLGILNQPLLLNKTILVQNSAEGKFFGVLDLTIGEKGAIKKYNGKVTGINRETPLDPEVNALVQEFEKQKELNRGKERENNPERLTQ